MRLPKIGLRQALVLLYITRPEMDDGFSSAQVSHAFGEDAHAALRALYDQKLVRKIRRKSGIPQTLRMWAVTDKGCQCAILIEKAFDVATA